jgi:ABC-2 type transport system permease protein
MPAEARAILDPGIWWGSFQVPVLMQVGLVILASAILLFSAVRLFKRTE